MHARTQSKEGGDGLQKIIQRRGDVGEHPRACARASRTGVSLFDSRRADRSTRRFPIAISLVPTGSTRFRGIHHAVWQWSVIALINQNPMKNTSLPIGYQFQSSLAVSGPNSQQGRDYPRNPQFPCKFVPVKWSFYFCPYSLRSLRVITRADNINARPSFLRTKKMTKYRPPFVCPRAA